jgi:hypothetical protein
MVEEPQLEGRKLVLLVGQRFTRLRGFVQGIVAVFAVVWVVMEDAVRLFHRPKQPGPSLVPRLASSGAPRTLLLLGLLLSLRLCLRTIA